MKKTSLMTAMAVVIGGAVMASAAAHAQTTPIDTWQPSQQAEQDPAKRVAPTSEATSQPVQAYSSAAPATAPSLRTRLTRTDGTVSAAVQTQPETRASTVINP